MRGHVSEDDIEMPDRSRCARAHVLPYNLLRDFLLLPPCMYMPKGIGFLFLLISSPLAVLLAHTLNRSS